jgi:hypothetical protein
MVVQMAVGKVDWMALHWGMGLGKCLAVLMVD